MFGQKRKNEDARSGQGRNVSRGAGRVAWWLLPVAFGLGIAATIIVPGAVSSLSARLGQNDFVLSDPTFSYSLAELIATGTAMAQQPPISGSADDAFFGSATAVIRTATMQGWTTQMAYAATHRPPEAFATLNAAAAASAQRLSDEALNGSATAVASQLQAPLFATQTAIVGDITATAGAGG